MADITLTEVESARATRFYAELRSLKYLGETLRNIQQVTESDFGAAKARVDYLQTCLQALETTLGTVSKQIDAAQKSLSQVLSEAVRRLDPTADTETYRVSVSEADEVVSLSKE